MLRFQSKPVTTVISSSRRVRSRVKPGLEALEPRDVPSSFAGSAMAASAVHHYPPQPIMPQVSLASVPAVHHYPPNPI